MQDWRARRWAFLVQLGSLTETEARQAMNLTQAELQALPAAEARALAEWLRVLEALNRITAGLAEGLLAEARAVQRRNRRHASLRAGAVRAATPARLCPQHRAKAAPK